tara:strand:- start:500 stop:757 length:258 start_codon:yes stop_codon:yes gene_type:complete
METLEIHDKWEYLYETVDSEPDGFREKVNHYLNEKGEEGWELASFSFCHDQPGGKLVRDYASCLFKRKGLSEEELAEDIASGCKN